VIFRKLKGYFAIFQMAITVSVAIIFMYIFRKNTKPIRVCWAKIQLFLLGIKLEVQGKEDKNANMVAMNHQSALDIVILEYLHSQDLAWVAKIQIANIPWFGHILKAPNMIMVQRESKSSLIKLLKDTKEKLNTNRPIAIFPEGTRTDGKKMLKFKTGAKMIAQKHNLLVQPIVLVGTRDIFDSQNILQKSGTVKLIYLPSVKAIKKTTWYEDMERDMREILEKELKQID
jgi:1-acyl-sn-glycerol-3-phosphate acyltransferase